MLVKVCVLFFLVLPWKTQQVFHRCWLLCLCVTRWSLPDRMFIIAVLLRSQWPVTDVFCVPENKTDFLKTDLFKHFFLFIFIFFALKFHWPSTNLSLPFHSGGFQDFSVGFKQQMGEEASAHTHTQAAIWQNVYKPAWQNIILSRTSVRNTGEARGGRTLKASKQKNLKGSRIFLKAKRNSIFNVTNGLRSPCLLI